jgi:hypothetical protein
VQFLFIEIIAKVKNERRKKFINEIISRKCSKGLFTMSDFQLFS